MVLKSLIVKNYRNIADLRIRQLSQVNLITGRNNTGKSSLLDAISIFACKGSFSWLAQLLEDREEFISYTTRSVDEESFERAISCLFTDRRLSESIVIGELEETLFNESVMYDQRVEIRPVHIIDEEIRHQNEFGKETIFSRQRRVLENEGEFMQFAHLDSRLGLEISYANQKNLYETRDLSRHSRNREFPLHVQYVHTQNIARESNAILWDKIALSYKESFIIEALKIVEPRIERLAFVSLNDSGNRYHRNPMVKLAGDENILPLKSMGDGINRILTIVLSLVNCENGVLLIDEIENGLHYSVQRLLWRIILDVAVKLNVQVFATSHSNDCIRAYGETLMELSDPYHYSRIGFHPGTLLRLEQHVQMVDVVEYSPENLHAAIKFNIETR